MIDIRSPAAREADAHADDRQVATILHACREWVWQMDDDCVLTFSSGATQDVLGLSPDDLVGRSYFSLLPQHGAKRFEDKVRAAIQSGQPIVRLLHAVIHTGGVVRRVEMNGAPLNLADPGASGYCGICRLLSDGGPETELEAAPEAIFDTVPTALCVVNREGRYLQFNREFARLLALPPHEISGRLISDFSLEGWQNFERDIEVFDRGGMVPDHEFNMRGRFYQVSVRPFRNVAGVMTGAALSFTDVSVYKRAERVLAAANERLQATAERDFLTGLLNRRQFEEIYRVEVSAARREQAPVSLLIADVDFFKRFNDRYGHPAGDGCLRRVARALAGALSRPRDVVCRYGGEEFVAILPNTDPIGALVVAERARKAIWELDIAHESSTLARISVSIGISTLMTIDPSLDMASRRRMLLEAADTALYVAKRDGRNCVRSVPMAGDS